MTRFLSLFPAVLGVMVVLQAGLNRQIASKWTLPGAVLLNSLVLITLASAGFLLTRSAIGLRTVLPDWSQFSLWFLVPGTVGFILVTGGPWAISRWGAAHTFVLLMTSQLASSLLWDLYVEKIPLSLERGLGVALALAGSLLFMRSSSH